MRQESVIGQKATEAERLPWAVESLRTVLTEAAQRGFQVGIDSPSLAAAAGKGAICAEEVGDGYDVVEELIESIRYTAELRLDADLKEAAYWLEMAIEAAVVLGLQAAAKGQSDAPNPTPQQAHGIVSDLLVQLVGALAASGRPVSGAQSFLDDLRREGETARELVMPHEGPSHEVRTEWIHNYDTGRLYQWCVLRQSTKVYVARRQAGERSVTPELSLRAAEADLLGRLLTQVVEGWKAA